MKRILLLVLLVLLVAVPALAPLATSTIPSTAAANIVIVIGIATCEDAVDDADVFEADDTASHSVDACGSTLKASVGNTRSNVSVPRGLCSLSTTLHERSDGEPSLPPCSTLLHSRCLCLQGSPSAARWTDLG